MQSVIGSMRKAIQEYDMIQEGDKIAVGLSGGKDSIALLEGLHRLQQFIGIPFSLMAITIDPCFNNTHGDYSSVEEFCAQREIPYVIQRSELATIIFDIRKEDNPCSLCARMRRGMIHDIAKEHGCNKLALGHHYDDAVETFLMNLFRGGRIACFQPVTYLSRKDLTMIRPLILLTEKQIRHAVRVEELPVVQSSCPVDGATAREDTKKLIQELERGDYPALRKNIMGAMRQAGLDGW